MDNVLTVLNNDYVLASLAIFASVYGTMARVKLPDFVVALFKNDVFRVVFLSLLLMYRLEKAPHVAIIVALVFVFTLDYISRMEAKEHFGVVRNYLESRNH